MTHSILVIAYNVLAGNGVECNDLGPDHFDRMNTAKLKRYHPDSGGRQAPVVER